MIKKIKKLLPAILALAVSCVMSINAFAAGSGTMTVNVDGGHVDKTYNIYKIFDLETGEGGEGVTYSISSAWVDFFFGTATADNETLGTGRSYLLEDDFTGDLPVIVHENKTYYVDVTGDNVQDFANTAMSYAKKLAANDGTHTVTAEDADAGKIQFSDLALGYYILVPMQSGTATGSNCTVCSLVNVKGEAEVDPKIEYPSVDKDVDDKDVEVGQVVTFTVGNVKVRDTSGYDSYYYRFTDTMSAGLTFGNSIEATNFTVKIDGTPIEVSSTDSNANAYVEFADNGYDLKLDVTKYQDYIDKDIVITYTATVNKDAVVNYTHNHVEFKYGNDDNWEEGGEKDVPVYSSEIIVHKIKADSEGGTTQEPLKDAEFVLYKMVAGGDGQVKKYYKATMDGNTLTKVEWVDNETDASKLRTGSDGKVAFGGLESGTYYLHETEAPAGYNLLKEDREVVISAPANDENQHPIGVTQTSTIENHKGTELPSTGGIGTTIFYLLGACLVLGSGLFLVVRRRMRTE